MLPTAVRLRRDEPATRRPARAYRARVSCLYLDGHGHDCLPAGEAERTNVTLGFEKLQRFLHGLNLLLLGIGSREDATREITPVNAVSVTVKREECCEVRA